MSRMEKRKSLFSLAEGLHVTPSVDDYVVELAVLSSVCNTGTGSLFQCSSVFACIPPVGASDFQCVTQQYNSNRFWQCNAGLEKPEIVYLDAAACTRKQVADKVNVFLCQFQDEQ